MTFLPMTLIRSGGLPLQAWNPLACGIPDWDVLRKAEQQASEQLLQAFDEALSKATENSLRTLIYNARKAFYQRGKLPSLEVEARLHTGLDFRQLLDCLEVFRQAGAEKQLAISVFEENLQANYEALQQMARDEHFQRALLFTSHDLLASLSPFAAKTYPAFDKRDRRTAQSVLQYLTRMVFKTSPLGRFTTVQVRDFNALESVADGIGAWMDTKSLVSPNVALLPAIYEVLLREPAFFESLKLVLNPSITFNGRLEDFKLAEQTWLYFDGEREAFQRLDSDPVADFVVKTFLENERNLSYLQLKSVLENEVEATEEQLQGLVFQLIDIGLLEWQLPEPGLTANWCSGLYNYLGYLPTSPTLTEAAYLMQWMRTAARTLSFQSVADAQSLQRDTVQTAKEFLEKNGGEMPPIPCEQIFFEDVTQQVPLGIPPDVLENLIRQLANCWQSKELHPISPFRSRIFEFARKILPEGQTIDFLKFSQLFLQDGEGTKRQASSRATRPRHQGKIGALLQVFQDNGSYKAVVNAMYPGGGKLFARWLSLFSTEVVQQVRHWQSTPASDPGIAAFPWQGWSNANFQPLFSSLSVAVPDGRVGKLPTGEELLLGNLVVQLDGLGFPQLMDKRNNQVVIFNDLGLEAPESRPPVMQVLWHLGMPFVSSDVLLPEGYGWEISDNLRFRNRVEFQSLVLARATWELSHEVYDRLFVKVGSASLAEQIGLGVAALKAMGIPQRFFGQFSEGRDKPQFYDMDSPVSMVLLEKKLRNGSGNFRLTEMLPGPEQWLGERVGEFVVEFEC